MIFRKLYIYYKPLNSDVLFGSACDMLIESNCVMKSVVWKLNAIL